MSKEKPINCPICDGKASCFVQFVREEAVVKFGVYCEDPECIMSAVEYLSPSPEEAIKKWNTRKPLDNIKSQLSAKIDAVRGYDTTGWNKYKQAIRDSIEIVERSKKIEQ